MIRCEANQPCEECADFPFPQVKAAICAAAAKSPFVRVAVICEPGSERLLSTLHYTMAKVGILGGKFLVKPNAGVAQG